MLQRYDFFARKMKCTAFSFDNPQDLQCNAFLLVYIACQTLLGSSTKNIYTSSIRFISHPANWMMILCNVVPWRKTSILGAAA